MAYRDLLEILKVINETLELKTVLPICSGFSSGKSQLLKNSR